MYIDVSTLTDGIVGVFAARQVSRIAPKAASHNVPPSISSYPLTLIRIN